MNSILEAKCEGLLLRISELTTPKIMLSLFLLPINLRQFSNLYNVSIGSLGGLYDVVIKNGLLLFLIILIDKICMTESLRSGLTWKLIVSRMKKPTPPPDLFLSFETQL